MSLLVSGDVLEVCLHVSSRELWAVLLLHPLGIGTLLSSRLNPTSASGSRLRPPWIGWTRTRDGGWRRRSRTTTRRNHTYSE